MSPTEVAELAKVSAAAITTIVTSIGGAVGVAARWRKNIIAEQATFQRAMKKAIDEEREKREAQERRCDKEREADAVERRACETRVADLRVRVAQLEHAERRRSDSDKSMVAVRPEGGGQ